MLAEVRMALFQTEKSFQRLSTATQAAANGLHALYYITLYYIILYHIISYYIYHIML